MNAPCPFREVRTNPRMQLGVTMSESGAGESIREKAVDDLTSKQRAHLRAFAQNLKPILHVGKDGITDGTVDAVNDAFNTREVLKIKILESAPIDAGEAASAIVERLGDSRLVQVIGRTAVLYRPDPDQPQIRLP